jgi:tetratricopeptide (TPR) repeat protein
MISVRDFSKVLRLLPIVVLAFSIARGWAQEESKADAQYREDYERFMKIKATADPVKRCDEFYEFLKQRPDSRLLKNAQAEYLLIMQGAFKAERYAELLPMAERFVNLFPKVGEAYYFYGTALKEQGKIPEAMDALAKCYVLKNPASERARQNLEFTYKAQNKGSLAGLDSLIRKARAEVSK